MSPCPDVLLCPVCEGLLRNAGPSLQCEQGHSFDLSREGYVNLLVAGHGTQASGDTREMVRARRRFLDTGTYRPLSDALNRTVLEVASTHPPLQKGRQRALSILDVGCGEGYYAGRLGKHLRTKLGEKPLCLYGMDASKEAARLAARRHPDVRFFVANLRNRILLADGSMDLILNVFAPRDEGEFARVLIPGGKALVVIPKPQHLAGLRSALPLLDLERDKSERVVARFATQFTLLEEQSLGFEVTLQAPALRDLVTMTPNYWHLNADDWKRVEAMGPRDIQAGFSILIFARRT